LETREMSQRCEMFGDEHVQMFGDTHVWRCIRCLVIHMFGDTHVACLAMHMLHVWWC